jgi:hypothetical protein
MSITSQSFEKANEPMQQCTTIIRMKLAQKPIYSCHRYATIEQYSYKAA